MRGSLGFSLLLLAACADAQDPAAGPTLSGDRPDGGPLLVADAREPNASVSDETRGEWGARPEIQAAMGAARAHWAAQDPALEPDLRVLSVAEGAFTETGAAEHAVLYLVSPWPRCCSKVGLAVVRDDRLVWNGTAESTTYDITRVPDLDGDGRDEVALWSSFMMGGFMEGSVSFVSLGAAPAGWEGTPVMESGCGAMRETEAAVRLTATPSAPGEPLAVSSEAFTRPCEGGGWSAAAEPEALTLAPLSASPLVVLPVE